MISDHPLRRRQQIVKRAIGAIVPLVLFTYLNNTSQFSSPRSGSASVFAHRGVGQRYDIPIESNTCTATHLLTPEHEYLENTIPSMRAAFDRGGAFFDAASCRASAAPPPLPDATRRVNITP